MGYSRVSASELYWYRRSSHADFSHRRPSLSAEEQSRVPLQPHRMVPDCAILCVCNDIWTNVEPYSRSTLCPQNAKWWCRLHSRLQPRTVRLGDLLCYAHLWADCLRHDHAH